MSDHSAAGRKRDKPSIVVGFILLALAGILWADAERLSAQVSYGIGPAVMPKIISVGLIVLAILSTLAGLRGKVDAAPSADFGKVGIVTLGFLGLTAIIGFGGGFIVAMAGLFAVTSFAFGRRAALVDFALGMVLSTLTYLLFTKVLTLSLPQGPLERLFG